MAAAMTAGLGSQALTILWAQYRTLVNQGRSGLGSGWVALLVSVIWYGLWAVAAVMAGWLTAQARNRDLLVEGLPTVLLLVFLYWQVIPVLMVSTGSSLDLRRLLPYPIRPSQLFAVEVLLRVTTGIEMVLLLFGIGIGAFLNGRVPKWGPPVLLLYGLFNMLFSAGVRDLIGRLLSRRRVREFGVLVLVLLAAVPQLLVVWQPGVPVRVLLEQVPLRFWPWAAASNVLLGTAPAGALAILLVWTAVAYVFGRSQFDRSLRLDQQDARTEAPRAAAEEERPTWRERLFRLPSALFPDPFAILVEKELRVLSRSARFRLVFIMGFTFGLIVWVPLLVGRAPDPDSFLTANYLGFIALYSVLLLGEVVLWNAFGFDRWATQAYYVLPVRMGTVVVGKNLAALLFITLEVALVAVVCGLLRLPITLHGVVQAFGLALVATVFLLALGNLGSVRFPYPVDPAQTWRRAASGRTQALLLVVYPLVGLPLSLAFLARYAFQSEAAFYAVLAVDLMVALILYWVALASATETLESDRERFLRQLSQGGGVLS